MTDLAPDRGNARKEGNLLLMFHFILFVPAFVCTVHEHLRGWAVRTQFRHRLLDSGAKTERATACESEGFLFHRES